MMHKIMQPSGHLSKRIKNNSINNVVHCQDLSRGLHGSALLLD